MGKHFRKPRVKGWHKVGLAASVIGTPFAVIGTANSATATKLPSVFNAIIKCESGGNPAAQNPASTASGKYQFLDSSWISYGGGQFASRAKLATPAQQDAIALAAFNRSGTTPWAASQSCWQHATQIPVRALTPVPTRIIDPSPPRHAARTYIVQPGDSLSKIARQQGIRGGYHALFNMNKCNIKNPNLIFPGQRINIA